MVPFHPNHAQPSAVGRTSLGHQPRHVPVEIDDADIHDGTSMVIIKPVDGKVTHWLLQGPEYPARSRMGVKLSLVC